MIKLTFLYTKIFGATSVIGPVDAFALVFFDNEDDALSDSEVIVTILCDNCKVIENL